jgi:phosphoribosylamine--glycine ligase
VFEKPDLAKDFLKELPGPWVIKTDGLASGKGVLVTDSIEEAEQDIDAKLSGEAFGEAGLTVVIEEGLSGPEFSLLAVTDGTRVVALAPAQDFKRLGTGDAGPNTGGMGAYSPVGGVDPAVVDRVLDESVEPTLAALRRRGIDYRGVLYAGLMLTADGPKVLEFNVRFGDPETQVVLPRFGDDLTGLLSEAASGRIRSDPGTSSLAAVCVVLASEGYPMSPRYGDVIEGLDETGALVFKDKTTGGRSAGQSVVALHGGTTRNPQGQFLTSGGRVLGITATGADVASARDLVYRAVAQVGWSGVQFRTDIAAGYPSSTS